MMNHKRLPKFEDCETIERLTGGDYLAVRNLIAYSSTEKGIILKDLSNGESRPVSGGGKGERRPVFSPDGTRLLFLSQQSGQFCVVIYNLQSAELTTIVRSETPVTDPIWSPDGSKILFASSISESVSNVAPACNEPIVIENLGYKFDGLGFRTPDNATHLFIVPSDGSAQPAQITAGNYDYLHHNWLPDSRHIICVSNRFRNREEYLGYDLLKIEIQTGEILQLTQNLWLVSYPNPLRPVCTPDGQFIIAGIMDAKYAKTISTGTFPETYLYKIAADGSSSHQIFFPDENCYQCVQFPYNAGSGMGLDKLQISDDGAFVLFHSGWQGQGGLFRLPLDESTGGHAQPINRGKHAYHGISKIQDGKVLVSVCEDTLAEAYILVDIDEGCIIKKVAQSAEEFLQDVSLSQPTDFSVPTLDGCSTVHGWVLPPHNMEEEKKYPVILYIHGGPHPFYTYALTLEHQAFAAEGFGVICCNPRGSSGYGWKHQNMGDGRRTEPYYDCLQFVDEAIRRFPWIDENRMGVTGGSYGGYMTNYIAAHSKRFKAYISQRSLANDQISYASSDETGSSAGFDSFPQFMMENLKRSVVSYAENIDRPFLILHGADDCRTPVEAAKQLYTAIRDIHPNLPVKLVLYPNTGHSQPEDPAMLQSYYNEMVSWFRKYL